MRATARSGGESHEPNTNAFVLDLGRLEWRRE
jgi:hypothetical protein